MICREPGVKKHNLVSLNLDKATIFGLAENLNPALPTFIFARFHSSENLIQASEGITCLESHKNIFTLSTRPTVTRNILRGTGKTRRHSFSDLTAAHQTGTVTTLKTPGLVLD